MAFPDYHLIQVAYFDSDNGVLSVNAFRKIWGLLADNFGSLKGNGSVSVNGAPVIDRKNIRLTSGVFLDANLERDGALPVYGGATFGPQKMKWASTDCDLDIGVLSAWPRNGFRIPAQLKLAISHRLVEKTGVEAVLSLTDQIYAICSAFNPFYGFIDVGLIHDAHAGAAYSSIPNVGVSIQQKVQMNEWVYNGALGRDKARSIYWGNYFGPKILNRLGGAEAFKRRFAKATQLLDGGSSGMLHEYGDSVYVALSRDPQNAIPSCGGMLSNPLLDDNLLWLQRDLANHEVLSCWSEQEWNKRNKRSVNP